MINNSLNQFNILGKKPLAVEPVLHPVYKRAEKGDLEAIFDLSRHYFNYEYYTDNLDAALYYKSLLVANFPEEEDPYSCAVTMMEIAYILAKIDQLELSKEWFVNCYRYVFENYPEKERRSLLEEIDFFETIADVGFQLEEVIIVTTD